MSEVPLLHVYPAGRRWAVRRYGKARASRTFLTKRSALSYAEGIALAAEHGVIYVHRDDATVARRISK